MIGINDNANITFPACMQKATAASLMMPVTTVAVTEENYSPAHTLLVAVEPSHYTSPVQEQTAPELYPVEEVNHCHDNSKLAVTGQ